jgi:8-amino-7-oxononanoate synthase
LGAKGGGVLAEARLDADSVPLLVGTLGKAFGCFGAFVAGNRDVVELVLQRARSYIYTTALPPAVAAAGRVGVRIAAAEVWRRERLWALIARFRAGALQLGLPLAASITPIQPLMIGDAARCVAVSDALRMRGFWVTAIRSPTVSVGSERLRITLSAAHDEAEVDALLDALSLSLRAVAVTQ